MISRVRPEHDECYMKVLVSERHPALPHTAGVREREGERGESEREREAERENVA